MNLGKVPRPRPHKSRYWRNKRSRAYNYSGEFAQIATVMAAVATGPGMPMKQKARLMLVMMNAINKSYFAGKRALTCYSFHRGARNP